MKKPTTTHPAHRLRIIVLSSIGGIAALVLLAALIIWVLWPVRRASLQTISQEKLSVTEANARVAQINATEQQLGVKPECYSKLYAQPKPTKKAVVMFHGVLACPDQFNDLAKYFYDRGYTVYVPRVPYHGLADKLEHSKVTAQGLVDYVNESVTIASTFGKLGVIGLSGGSNLGTWATEYRPEVTRLLTLSPFYEPNSSQAPKWQLRPLMVLHGNNILPDQLNKPDDPQNAVSYRALAKYMIIYNNLQRPAQNKHLEKLALVMADDDHEIDQELATKVLGELATANNIPLIHEQIPASYKLGHDIVGLANDAVVQHQDYLYAKYFQLYNE